MFVSPSGGFLVLWLGNAIPGSPLRVWLAGRAYYKVCVGQKQASLRAWLQYKSRKKNVIKH
jgi:hypothetical protein